MRPNYSSTPLLSRSVVGVALSGSYIQKVPVVYACQSASLKGPLVCYIYDNVDVLTLAARCGWMNVDVERVVDEVVVRRSPFRILVSSTIVRQWVCGRGAHAMSTSIHYY